jgi:hypothetical protein
MLLNSVLGRASGAGVHALSARIQSRALPRDRDTFWVVSADSERVLRWLGLPWGAPIGLSPSGLGSLKALPGGLNPVFAIIFREWP